MRRRGEADEPDGDSHILHLRDEHHRHHAQQHRRFAPGIDGPAALDQQAREPAAADAADIREAIDEHERRAEAFDIELEVGAEEEREQIQVPAPDRVGEEFGEDEGPRLPIREQAQPGDRRAIAPVPKKAHCQPHVR